MLSPTLGDTVCYIHIMYYFYRIYSAESSFQLFMEPGLNCSPALFFSFLHISLCSSNCAECRNIVAFLGKLRT